MNSIRLFLECNQIFFEVFYYVVVGIAGIIFSRYQYKSNKRQVEMHKMQIEMQNKESQPIFKIKYRIDSHKEKNDTEYMEIYNEGELFKSFNYKIETFYKLQYSSCENGINSIYYVPIYDYYCFGERTENLTTGKLVKKYLPENHAKFYKLYTEAIELSKNNNYIFINRFSLIKIEYIDIYNNPQTVYLEDGLQINSNLYNDIIGKSEEVFRIPFSIDEIKELKTLTEYLKLPVS